MNYWPFWVSGLALASIMLFHAYMTGRMMGVSGRVTALVNRFRDDSSHAAPAMSQADLLAAIESISVEEFGGSTSTTPSSATGTEATENAPTLSQTSTALHASFLVALLVGGFLAALAQGHFSITFFSSATLAPFLQGSKLLATITLFAGGIAIGFGTRMAGGCTSGHGLCGVSRVQPGSLLTTAAFFGAGIVVSFALELL